MYDFSFTTIKFTVPPLEYDSLILNLESIIALTKSFYQTVHGHGVRRLDVHGQVVYGQCRASWILPRSHLLYTMFIILCKLFLLAT